MDAPVPFGGGEYFVLVALLLFSRGMDFLSTWIATPNLVLEANPIARKLGWRGGIAFNLLVCLAFARWPLPAIIISTTSLLVAARNLQSAWLMRTLGEEGYRAWMTERIGDAQLGLYLACLLLQTLLIGGIGAALVWFSGLQLVPFGIGVGIIGYSFAVILFTSLSVWRIRRALG